MESEIIKEEPTEVKIEPLEFGNEEDNNLGCDDMPHWIDDRYQTEEIKIEHDIDIEYHQIELFDDISEDESDVNVEEWSEEESNVGTDEIEKESNVLQIISNGENVGNQCKVCRKVFSRSAALKSHTQVHSVDNDEELLFEMDESNSVSGSDFKCDRNLVKIKKTQVQRYKKSNSLLTKNVSSSENVDSLSVTKIAETSKTSVSGNYHETSCTTSKDPIDLERFLNTENGKYKCNICGKYLRKMYNLKKHVKYTHLNIPRPKERRYTTYKTCMCELCGKILSGSTALKSHMNGHAGIKPFRCDKCEKRFAYQSSLSCHIESVHSDRKLVNPLSLTCSVCGQLFNTVRYLKRHSRLHTAGERNTCPTCGKRFISGRLKRHLAKKRPCVDRKSVSEPTPDKK